MIIPGLLLVLLSGYSVIHYLDAERASMEKIGLSFFLGMGYVTICMFLLEISGITISTVALYGLLILCIVVINTVFLYRSKTQNTGDIFDLYVNKTPFSGLTSGNWLWYAVMTAVILLTFSSVIICLYWPPFKFDHITAYDLMGKVIAAEGEIDNSLFSPDGSPPKGTNRHIFYPPLVSGSFAYAYLHGLETSKIISACYFLFFVIAFYSLTKRETNYLNAGIASFFVIITPNLFKYSSLSTTNIPFAIYMMLGFLYLYRWIIHRRNADLLLGGFMLGLSAWTRSEGIVFVVIGFFAVLVVAWKYSNWNRIWWYVLCSFPFFIAWSLFVEWNFQVIQMVFHPYPYLDLDKLKTVFTYLYDYLFSLRFFGITSFVFVMAVLTNIKRIPHDNMSVLLMLTVSSLLGITLIYYQIDYTYYNSLEALMSYSYHRELFGFIPLFWLYAVGNEKAVSFGDWINKKLERRSTG